MYCYLHLFLHSIQHFVIAVKGQIKVKKFEYWKSLRYLKLKQETSNYEDEKKRS